MDALTYFMPQEPSTKSVLISSRFTDEAGEKLPFVIRPVTEAESRDLRIRCRTERGVDRERYYAGLVCASVVSPALDDERLQKKYGVLGEEALLSKMLLAGEYARLLLEVQALCGFEPMEREKELAKN